MQKALITGITGQDGAYLARLLLDKGYEVHGIKRRSSSFNTTRVDEIFEDPKVGGKKFFLHYGDLTDGMALASTISYIKPDEIYNLGAQSHVQVSFAMPEYTTMVNGLGTLKMLEAIRISGLLEHTKFYQASTSELFGNSSTKAQNEETPLAPRSPYAAAKLYAYWTTVNYREAHSAFASNGILFNHESPLRGETFVTQKIANAVAKIHLGQLDQLTLGNLDAKRDWGHARDFVEGMWQILQHNEPDDFVLATGETHSVRHFVELAFKVVGVDIEWNGHGLYERGFDKSTGKLLVATDRKYFRQTEVDFLQGDASKAKRILGWKPNTTIDQLTEEMVFAAIARAKVDH